MRTIVSVIIITLLSGCAMFIETKLSVLHEVELPLSGMTYVFVQTKEQEGSLEFHSYAKLVKSEMG